MVDASQTYSECFINNMVKPYSIEWLCTQCNLMDPFVSIVGRRPNSTTHHPKRDIDFLYTHGVELLSLSTMGLSFPAQSVHLGIVFDIDMDNYNSTKFSDMSPHSPRSLTSGNKKTVDNYIKYINQQIEIHNIEQRIQDLYTAFDNNPSGFSDAYASQLN